MPTGITAVRFGRTPFSSNSVSVAGVEPIMQLGLFRKFLMYIHASFAWISAGIGIGE
jgi:hypothetical protein